MEGTTLPSLGTETPRESLAVDCKVVSERIKNGKAMSRVWFHLSASYESDLPPSLFLFRSLSVSLYVALSLSVFLFVFDYLLCDFLSSCTSACVCVCLSACLPFCHVCFSFSVRLCLSQTHRHKHTHEHTQTHKHVIFCCFTSLLSAITYSRSS